MWRKDVTHLQDDVIQLVSTNPLDLNGIEMPTVFLP